MLSSFPRFLITAAVLTALTACSFVSRDGPSTGDISSPSREESGGYPYRVVDLTTDVVEKVKRHHDHGLDADFSGLPNAQPVGLVGAGDVLHLSVWEAAPQQGSVFGQGHGADIVVVVDDEGTIAVPYGGRFHVAGLSLPQVEEEVAQKLKGKAYAPQISIQWAESVYNTVFIQGEVGHPGRFPLSQGGSSLLDLLALAGGSHLQPHETMVQVMRGGHSVMTDLYRIMHDPSLNIALSPGDSISLSRRTDMFYAFGAVSRVGQNPFSEHTTTLLQALGAISGLQDERANPRGVFIFRHEDVELAKTLPLGDGEIAKGHESDIVYNIDMDNPNSFFMLDRFPVRPSDIIYVSDAPSHEFGKFMDAIMGSTGNTLNMGLSAATLAK